MKRLAITLVTGLIIFSSFFIINTVVNKTTKAKANSNVSSKVFEPNKGVNQKPTPIKIERIGKHEVNIEMTAQITNIQINKGDTYKAWTFNGQAPGPVIVVNQGDQIHLTLKNMDPSMPHSMDIHAVQASRIFVSLMKMKLSSKCILRKTV